MNKENTPKKTRQRTLIFVAMLAGFLGTGIFAGINASDAYQKNQDVSQSEAEEKFARLPQYLLNERLLLKDKDAAVRSSAAKALGALHSKESSIPELTKLLNDPETHVQEIAVHTLDQLQSRKATENPINPIKYSYDNSDPNITKIVISPVNNFQMMLMSKGKKTSETKILYVNSDVFTEIEESLKTFSLPIQADRKGKYSYIFRDVTLGYKLDKLQIKEVISRLMIALEINKHNTIEYYEILETLMILDGLDDFSIREAKLKAIRELEELDVFSDPRKKSFAINTLVRIYLKYNQRVKEFMSKQPSINQFRKMRDQQWILTGATSVTSLLLLLLTLFSLRQVQRISWNNHLICYFPEEVVGELIALRHELTQANQSKILIETKLLYEIFTLVWGFYIQINIDNLSLPSKDQRRR